MHLFFLNSKLFIKRAKNCTLPLTTMSNSQMYIAESCLEINETLL